MPITVLPDIHKVLEQQLVMIVSRPPAPKMAVAKVAVRRAR